MTEAEWLSRRKPAPMLDYLVKTGAASDRKLRLYLCGGCRTIAGPAVRPESLAAVEAAERFADGLATREELQAARTAARTVARSGNRAALLAANAAALDVSWAVGRLGGGLVEASGRKGEVRLLHDLFGNPFRPASIDGGWRTPAVLDLARRIYDDRTFALMPALGTALSDAGCTDQAILRHCAGRGRHRAAATSWTCCYSRGSP